MKQRESECTKYHLRHRSHMCTHTHTHTLRCRESEMKADRSLRLMAQVKNGVNHLSEKLQHIKAVSLQTTT